MYLWSFDLNRKLIWWVRFASLPKPKETEWELELPEEQREPSGTGEMTEEDAAERDRRNEEMRRAAQWAEFKRQTQVIQRALPRPSVVDIDALVKRASEIEDPAERLIAQEMALLISNDAMKYPVSGSKVHGKAQLLVRLDEENLNKARMEVLLEQPPDPGATKVAEFQQAWEDIHTSARLPGLAGYGEDEVDEYQLMIEAFDVSSSNGNRHHNEPIAYK